MKTAHVCKRMTITLLVAAALGVTLAVQVAEANDSYQRLVSRWITERDALVQEVVRSWLRGATPESLRGDMLQIVNYDVRLANEGAVPLYITHFREPTDLELNLADLIRVYLRNLGIQPQTEDFFRGKEFQIMREKPTSRGRR